MIRFLKVMAVTLVLALGGHMPAQAQDLSAIARVDGTASGVTDGWFGRTQVTLAISQGVPFRVFHLDAPARLVVDFQEVDFEGVSVSDLLETPGRVTDMRFGPFQPGWSRLVLDLAEPMLPETIAMPTDPDTGRATLEITLKSASSDAFAARAGVPEGVVWDQKPPQPVAKTARDTSDFVIVIDPGHGGIDPGAVREGIKEKDIMLTMARGVAETLARSGQAKVYLTRNEDVFVSLPARVGMAHRAEADLFVSMHADALSSGQAHGATVYTLSDEASDAASAQLAAQHNRADIIAGVDLAGTDDAIADVLLDLARLETAPRSTALADTLLEGLAAADKPIAKNGHRQAGFAVLKSADIPSVLLEVGFLSSPRDLANLRDPVWRSEMVQVLAQAILDWRADDLARRPLVRQ